MVKVFRKFIKGPVPAVQYLTGGLKLQKPVKFIIVNKIPLSITGTEFTPSSNTSCSWWSWSWSTNWEFNQFRSRCCRIPFISIFSQYQNQIGPSQYQHLQLTAFLSSLASSSSLKQKQQDQEESDRQVAKYQGIGKLPKGHLKTMEISKELFEKILTPELKTLAAIFDKYGYQIRLAGGAVRDLLSGQIPADIDFATTATPEEMKSMFEKEEVRMINAKGEKHGTITARINDKENFEVTTLRIDVVTDGRHAEVEFTKNWELDAARRDLTINSMFMDLSGTVYDYFNGAEDLRNKKVRFVGNPVQRIQEDYLRILRYFRFYGRISQSPDSHETTTLQAMRENMSGLQRISGERLWMELRKILAGNFHAALIQKMVELGVSPYIGLPENPNIEEFQAVAERTETEPKINPITLLSALLRNENEAKELNARLKLSTFERDLCLFIILHRNTAHLEAETSIKSFQRVVMYSKSKLSDVRSWVEETYRYNGRLDLLKEFMEWELPKFPVSGHALVELNVPAGPAITRVMMALKELWIESEFKLPPEELLKQVPEILETVQEDLKRRKKIIKKFGELSKTDSLM